MQGDCLGRRAGIPFIEGMNMADSRLLRRLDQVAGRMRWMRGLWTATIGWLILSLLIVLLRQTPSWAWCAVLFGVPTVLLVALVVSSRRLQDRHDAAILIERTYPQLDSRLLTAIEQHPRSSNWDFSFLQSELFSELFAQLRDQDWQQAVASSRVRMAHVMHLGSILLCLVLLTPLIRNLDDLSADAGSTQTSENESAARRVAVEPGNVELERGKSLLIMARFNGAVPGQVELVAHDAQQQEIRVPLRKSLNDPLFGTRLPSVNNDLTYHVEFDGERSEEYQVTTFVNPALVKADATLNYPDYTQRASQTLKDVRQITVVEGSQVELDCEFNKGVQTATLSEAGSDPIQSEPVQPEPADPTAEIHMARFRISLSKPGKHRYQLHLKDPSGRVNPEPVEFRVTVVENRAPDLKISFPSRDLRVSPLQELELQASASDDFGLRGFGLIYQSTSGSEQTIEFKPSTVPDEATKGEHLLAMEQMQVHPDDLVSYYFYAEDIGPDGKPRRSFSDLFFAEVRPFEEIFRQQASSPGSNAAGQSGGESGQLLELQRQVVTAAWNVLRQARRQDAEKLRADLQTLEQSQQQVQQVARQAAGELRDALQKQYAEAAIQQMGEAAEAFQQALTANESDFIAEGRTRAQDAYQSLLKLQARENLVQQSQSQPGQSGSSSNRMNQQLQSLQLKNDRDRYETERQARPEQESASETARRILDKLRELARRQEDLNDRIRELEYAMKEAVTPEEKEELARQLKRLQNEQEDLLRQLDEARDQMSQSPDQSRMNEARQQADSVRDRIRESSEALKQGQTSRALTEGTRAGQQLHELEEELRQQTSGQFTEEMRQLRDDVRQLARQEESLARELTRTDKEKTRPQRTLRDVPEPAPDSLSEDFARQKEQLQKILEQTKKLVEDSESSEPLLSRKLYETLRELRRDPPEEALDEVVQFTQQGFRSQLSDVEQRARTGIQQLQRGVEEAAESILGNEAESLRRAQSELAELRESIRRELALNSPESLEPGTDPDKEDTSSRTGSSSQNSDKSRREQPVKPGENSGSQNEKTDPENSDEAPSGGSPADRSSQRSSNPASDRQSSRQSQRSNQNRSDQPGDSPSDQPSRMNAGERSADGAPSPSGSQDSPERNSTGSQPSTSTGDSGEADGNEPAAGALNMLLGLGGMGNSTNNQEQPGPLAGSTYAEWTRRMQDVEEMLTTPQLRSQATAIRNQARQARIEVKRHSREPDWKLVRTSIYGPLLELETQISEELARRDERRHLVPIDRDPVPEKYSGFVKRYYEELSRRQVKDR